MISGQFVTNFSDLYQTLEADNLVAFAGDSDELAEALCLSLTLAHREHYALEGPRFVDQHRGALDTQYDLVDRALSR